jgi:hypothetical protein
MEKEIRNVFFCNTFYVTSIWNERSQTKGKAPARKNLQIAVFAGAIWYSTEKQCPET